MKIKYFDLSRVITREDNECVFVGHITTKDREESQKYGYDCLCLICPEPFVDLILKYADSYSRSNKITKAVRKMLATGRHGITISMRKVINSEYLWFNNVIIEVDRVEFEDDEFNDEDDEKYYLIKSFKCQ